MFTTHVILSNYTLEHADFLTIEAAFEHAKHKSREKVWKLWDDTVYCGDVEVRVYNGTNYIQSFT
jgi:hypothetical protein